MFHRLLQLLLGAACIPVDSLGFYWDPFYLNLLGFAHPRETGRGALISARLVYGALARPMTSLLRGDGLCVCGARAPGGVGECGLDVGVVWVGGWVWAAAGNDKCLHSGNNTHWDELGGCMACCTHTHTQGVLFLHGLLPG